RLLALRQSRPRAHPARRDHALLHRAREEGSLTMAHVIHYVFKSTQATLQFVGAIVIAALSVLLLFSTVFRWRFESNLREGIAGYATNDGDPESLLVEARSAHPEDLRPHLFIA